MNSPSNGPAGRKTLQWSQQRTWGREVWGGSLSNIMNLQLTRNEECRHPTSHGSSYKGLGLIMRVQTGLRKRSSGWSAGVDGRGVDDIQDSLPSGLALAAATPLFYLRFWRFPAYTAIASPPPAPRPAPRNSSIT